MELYLLRFQLVHTLILEVRDTVFFMYRMTMVVLICEIEPVPKVFESHPCLQSPTAAEYEPSFKAYGGLLIQFNLILYHNYIAILHIVG